MSSSSYKVLGLSFLPIHWFHIHTSRPLQHLFTACPFTVCFLALWKDGRAYGRTLDPG